MIIFGLVKNETERNEKKLIKLEKEWKQTQKADQYRYSGRSFDYLLHEIEQGMKSITLDNFYEENETIVIELDPRKSPSKNAQAYFSRYQKLKNAIKHLEGQINSTKAEIHYLESVMTQIMNFCFVLYLTFKMLDSIFQFLITREHLLEGDFLDLAQLQLFHSLHKNYPK